MLNEPSQPVLGGGGGQAGASFFVRAHIQPKKKDKYLIQTRDKWDLKQCLQFQHFLSGG